MALTLPGLSSELATWTLALTIPIVLLHVGVSKSPFQSPALITLGFLTVTSVFWLTIVSDIVPQPYLVRVIQRVSETYLTMLAGRDLSHSPGAKVLRGTLL